MKVSPVNCNAAVISQVDGLDTIHVFWVNVEPGQGYVTIICWGCAWTAYFGGMSALTIEEFFLSADVPYLVSKMGFSRVLAGRKKDLDYLARIIKAVKDSFALPSRASEVSA